METSYSQSQMEQKNLWVRERPERGEEQEILKESQMNHILQPNFKTTRHGMMRKLKVTSGRSQEKLIYRHHVCTPSQTVRAEREIISYSVCVHRCYQNNSYVTGRNLGKTDWSLPERGWSTRIVRCMDRIHKVCSNEERPPEGDTWSGRLTRKQRTFLLDDVWPDLWKIISDASKKSKAKMGNRETNAPQCQTIERNIL